MCKDFLILLAFNDLRTFSEEVRKESKSMKNMFYIQRFKDFSKMEGRNQG